MNTIHSIDISKSLLCLQEVDIMSSHSKIWIVINQGYSFDGEMERHIVLGTMASWPAYLLVHPIQDNGVLSSILCLICGCILVWRLHEDIGHVSLAVTRWKLLLKLMSVSKGWASSLGEKSAGITQALVHQWGQYDQLNKVPESPSNTRVICNNR